MLYLSRNFKGSTAESNVYYGVPAQEVSERKTISNWAVDHSLDVLVKDVCAFCFCLKNLSEVKLKIMS